MLICADCLSKYYQDSETHYKVDGACDVCGRVVLCSLMSSQQLVPKNDQNEAAEKTKIEKKNACR